MTTLVIAAQDIRAIDAAMLTDGKITHVDHADAQPEDYLHSLDAMLRKWGIKREVIDEIVVVAGPGSFTASRVATTIANALAFAQDIPVKGIENPKRLPLSDLLASIDLKAVAESVFVAPVYDRPPHITWG